MKRTLLALLLVAVLMATFSPISASAAPVGGGSRVIALGTAVDHGRLVQGFAFVHGRAGQGKPDRPPKSEPLYTFLAKGAKWRTTENYVVNPANGDGVASALVMDAMKNGVATWDAQAAADIIGNGTTTNESLQSDWVSPDGVNEVYFSQSELDAGTVAVTIVWGVFGGPPSTREIIEWDMVFNDALPESWGDATVHSSDWDVLNIATHELGHTAGLGDLYSASTVEQTMYGYASPGEVKKRTLESGDIAGIKALYQ